MSDRTLEIRIVAKDGSSRVFREVADAATKTGTALQKAGTDGKTGLDKIDKAAKTADQSVEKVGATAKQSSVDMTALGAAVGTAAGVVAQLGDAYRDQERQVSGITALYGEQSAAILQMAEGIQDFTRYSNDAAREGALIASSLSTNYGIAADDIAELVSRSADLAQVFGVDLADAVQRTAGAIRGEGEAAERLGLNMSDAAIAARALDAGITNWNVAGALSEAEKAAFRFQVFLQDTEATVGTAAAAADNAAGRFREFTNEMQDAAQSAGGFLGPVGQVAAEMAPLSLALPLAGAGLGKLATGMRVAAVASRAFMLTPLGLAVTAVTGALALATGAFISNRNEAAATAAEWEAAEASAASLEEQIRALAMVDWSAGNQASEYATKVVAEFDWLTGEIENIAHRSMGTGNWFDEMVREQMSAEGIDINRTDIAASWARVADDMLTAMTPDQADKTRFTDAMSDLLSLEGVLGDTHFDAIQSEMERLFDTFNNADGAISVDEFNASLERLYENNLQAAQGIDVTTLAMRDLAAAQEQWQDLGAGSIGEMTEEMQGYQAAVESTAKATRDQIAVNKEMADAQQAAIQERGQHERDAAAAQDDAWAEQRQRAEAGHEADRVRAEERRANAEQNRAALGQEAAGYTAIAAEAEAAAAQIAEIQTLATSLAGLDDPLTALNASGMANEYSLAAAAVRDAGTALDDTFRIVVGNTNAIAQQSQGITDWANELIGVQGEWAVIDDLLHAGIITIGEYNAAQAAQIEIAQSNAEIQAYMQEIQAKQAPLIATQTEALENQFKLIAMMPEQQQLAALGWLDQASAAKAMEIQTLAAAVATDQLGANGEAAFQSFINGITATDPAMTEMLQSMGLIEEKMNADGTYSVNLDGVEGAISDMDRLTDSIVGLVDYLDDGLLNGSFSIDIEADTADAEAGLATVDQLTRDADGRVVRISAEADTEAAAGGIEVINGLYRELDGRVMRIGAEADTSQATSSIMEVVNQIGGIDGRTSTVYVAGDGTGGSTAISTVAAALGNLDGDVATTYANTVDSASGVIGAVASALSGLDGRTATSYVNTVYTRYENTVYSGRRVGPSDFAHGGMVNLDRFAGGGVAQYVPFWAAENGPEVAHFPTGGTVVLPHEGMYAAPPMTYISPNNAVSNSYGGETINLTINVEAGVDRDYMRQWAVSDFAPALERALAQRRRSQGVLY